MRIDAAFEAFLAARQAQGLSAGGEAHYRAAWAVFRRARGSGTPTEASVRAMMSSAGRSQATYAERRAVAQVLDWMRRSGWRGLPDVRPPVHAPVTGRAAMTASEVAALLRGVHDPLTRRLGFLVYQSGVSVPLWLGVTLQGVDWASSSVTFTSAHTGQQVMLGMQAPIMEALQDWRGQRDRRAAAFFHGPCGGPLHVPTLSRTLRAAGARLGRPVGFGHLQYANLRLLAARYPMFDADLVETRQIRWASFRFLRIPNLFTEGDVALSWHDVR